MILNDQIVKLWVTDQISKIQRKMDSGYLLPWVGRAKIEILEDFYDTFDLDKITIEIEYRDKV